MDGSTARTSLSGESVAVCDTGSCSDEGGGSNVGTGGAAEIGSWGCIGWSEDTGGGWDVLR